MCFQVNGWKKVLGENKPKRCPTMKNIPRLIYKHLHVTKMAVTIKTTEVFGDNERHYAVQRLDLV